MSRMKLQMRDNIQRNRITSPLSVSSLLKCDASYIEIIIKYFSKIRGIDLVISLILYYYHAHTESLYL